MLNVKICEKSQELTQSFPSLITKSCLQGQSNYNNQAKSRPAYKIIRPIISAVALLDKK